MTTFRFSLGPAAVFVTTSIDLVRLYEGMVHSPQPPLVSVRRAAIADGPTLKHVESADSPPLVEFERASSRLIVRASRHVLDGGVTLFHLAYLLLERELQLCGFVTAHCAAVAREKRAVILLGKTGAGKTTTAVKLCRESGFRLVGNDLCVVGMRSPTDGIQVLAGTRYLLLRYLALTRSFRDIGIAIDETADPWRSKICVAPEMIGVQTEERAVNVHTAVFVHVDENQGVNIDEEYDDLVLRLYLHENFSRYIRATTTPFLVGDAYVFGPYVPPLDCASAYEHRVAVIHHLLQTTKVRYISGTAQHVHDRILARFSA